VAPFRFFARIQLTGGTCSPVEADFALKMAVVCIQALD
jgi:hypothetical protein